MYICICVFVCMHIHVCEYGGMHREVRGELEVSISLHLVSCQRWNIFICSHCLCQAVWPVSFQGLFWLHLTCWHRVWGLDIFITISRFKWILGTKTHVLTLVQQELYSMRCLPRLTLRSLGRDMRSL